MQGVIAKAGGIVKALAICSSIVTSVFTRSYYYFNLQKKRTELQLGLSRPQAFNLNENRMVNSNMIKINSSIGINPHAPKGSGNGNKGIISLETNRAKLTFKDNLILSVCSCSTKHRLHRDYIKDIKSTLSLENLLVTLDNFAKVKSLMLDQSGHAILNSISVRDVNSKFNPLSGKLSIKNNANPIEELQRKESKNFIESKLLEIILNR